jgi:dipeptidyl aminopeptidase/acylaminoacyl peptidase
LKKTLLVCLFPLFLAAQPKADPRIAAILNDLSSTHNFEDVSISPDGQRVAWVESENGTSQIFVKDLTSSSKPGRVAEGRSIAWSPDSKRLAYLSEAQLYVVSATGKGAKKLTNLTGFVTDPEWSPDGSRIAILYAENAPGGGGPLNAEPVETGVIGGAIHNQRLTIVDANSGATKQISPADLNIYEYDWSPDGHTFVATAAPGPGDNNWWLAQLYVMPVDSGQMTAIYKPTLQLALPRWSPDGSTIAFIEGLMSDEGFTGGEVYTIPASGGSATDRTPLRKSTPTSIAYTGPQKLLMTEIAGGESVLTTLDLSTNQTERLFEAPENLHAGGNYSNFSLSRDGHTAAAVQANWEHPPEVWAGPIGDWKQITHANTSHHPEWGQAKSIDWSSDGASVQGWLLYPHDFDASKRYPMVVSIHGGPANWNSPHWPGANFDLSILSALGYFVFYPNPRGSYGQGEPFTHANVKDFGYGDLRDILAGVDAVLKTAPVDPDRLGVAGWSYGGYMTMWTVTQTHRFKAAVSGAGISDWLSYYGENSIDQWMIPYFGASVYDDPAVYAKSSPITYIKNVQTPTLIVVGERDGECPAPQSYEFWHALETVHVPTQLVVYPGEGHAFRQPDHKRDVIERTVNWFNQYLR